MPVVAPKVTAVAAPPMLRVVAVVLNRLAVALVVANVPEFALIFPAAVIVLDASIVEAPAIAPVAVIPPPLLLMEPLTESPPALIV